MSDSSMAKLKTKQEQEAAAKAEMNKRIISKYKERISSLQTKKCWNTSLYNYQGFWYFSRFTCCVEGVMASQDCFQVGSPDNVVVLATEPKCGTTWLKALAFAIVTRTNYKNNGSPHPLEIGNPHDYVPFIEVQLIFRENQAPHLVETTDPQLMATHVPYTSLPESVRGTGCRIVYLCRNPKDMFISLWFFVKNMEHVFPDQNMTFEEAFDLFCQGISPMGSYWDHVLGYYKASLEHPNKVLFLKYEELKKDTFGQVKRLAEFLNRPFTADEEAEGVVGEIVKLCSFENMKSLESNKDGGPRSGRMWSNELFFREGKVGDFANHLTPEMIKSIDKVTQEKFRGYDLSF